MTEPGTGSDLQAIHTRALIVSRGQVHSYVTLYCVVLEARRALHRSATFLRKCLAARWPPPIRS